MMLIGSIEAGGTKFVCAVGDEDYRVQDQIICPTTTPGNIEKTVDYFKQFDINALGIASFGPIEIRKIHQNQDILRLHQRWDGEMLMC